MKLLRWTVAGASFYVIYKYAIGKKAKGEDVFKSPENDPGDGALQGAGRPKRSRARNARKSSTD